MTPLEMLTCQTEVLDGLVDQVESLSRRGISPVVVFDLDDTLLSTDQRHIRILREFATQASVRSRYLKDAWSLIQIEPCLLHYCITQTAERAGVLDPEILKELREFWFARFFSNDYIKDDQATPGAADYCQELFARGATIVYLTGRDETMREGTLFALLRNGFPMPGASGVVLILKPRFDMPDFDYKANCLRRIEGMGPVAGGFENEPAHINLLHEAFPNSRMIFMESKHSGKPVTPHPKIARIKNFIRG